MKIADIINVVGRNSFKSVEFGPAFVEVLNGYLRAHVFDDVQLLDENDTGEDARLALYFLPPDELAKLALTDFDIGNPQTTMTETPPPQKAGGISNVIDVGAESEIVVEPITSNPVTPTPPVKVIVERRKENVASQNRSWMAMAMGGALVAATLMLAVSMSVSTIKTGQMPDSSALKSVLQIVGEVVKAYMKETPKETPADPPAG